MGTRHRLGTFVTVVALLSLVALRSAANWEEEGGPALAPSDAGGCTSATPKIYIGDFNEDGRSDLGIYRADENAFYVSLSTGSRFDAPGSGRWVASNFFGHSGGQYYVGDFDGDDKSDLGFFNPGNNSFHVSTSTGEAFGGYGSGQWIAPNQFGHSNGRFYVALFNGGRKADLGFFDAGNSSFHVSLSTGSAFGADHSGQWIAPGTFGHPGGQYHIGDYDKDGSQDLGYFEPSNNSFHISFSNGEGFGGPGSGQWIAPGTFGHSGGRFYVGDFDGDDKADLGFFNPGNNSFHVNLSTGGSFGSIGSGRWVDPNTFGHQGGEYYVGNFDGDAEGKADLAFYEPSDNSFHVSLSTGLGFDASGSGKWASLNLCRLYLPLTFDKQRVSTLGD